MLLILSVTFSLIHLASNPYQQQIQKGASGACADDTKGMKSAIIDWITPKGQSLNPHIPCNIKSGCGFNHECTGALLCPAGLDWANSECMYLYLSSHKQVSALKIWQHQGEVDGWADPSLQ